MTRNLSAFRWLTWICGSVLILATAPFLGGCTGKGGLFNQRVFRDRAPETPAPSDTNVEKSFFVDSSGKPKSFLCGWAPVSEAGPWASWYFLHLAHQMPHCNLEFEIRESALVGKLINPSFPNDPSRWLELVEIPISSHFYYEKEKDRYGRDTNVWIENSARSHWSARPMMRLELGSMRIHDIGDWVEGGFSFTTAFDIEWDKQLGFLGFTVNIKPNLFPGFAQAQMRINFLRFNHDSSFKKVPYHQANARHMNILHVMGRRHDMEPELYAARWDQRKTHKLYLTGVPNKQVEALLVSAVEKWNQTFVDEGIVPKGQKLFEPVVANTKYSFDLRYPGIAWVDERRLSASAPLGIGQAHADVRNGQILWGGVILWGGYLEEMINRDTPLSEAGSSLGRQTFPLQLTAKGVPQRLNLPEMLAQSSSASAREMAQRMLESQQRHFEVKLSQLEAQSKKGGSPELSKEKAEIQQSLTTIRTLNAQSLMSMLVDVDAQRLALRRSSDEVFSRQSLVQMMGYEDVTALNNAQAPRFPKADRAAIAEILKSTKSPAERIQRLRSFIPQVTSGVYEEGRTFENLAPAFQASPAHRLRSFRDMYEGVVMELTLHEIGHMVGLGHSFKENVLPEEGHVPKKVFSRLKSLATPEAHFTNSTSVMGYSSGKVWLLVDAKAAMPGPQDRLVLKYLYRGEASYFDPSQDQLVSVPVPMNGLIADQVSVAGKQLQVSYYPTCNDYEASLAADPFCKRWDMGSTAQQIVENEFAALNDNLPASLFRFAGGGTSSHWAAEWILWYRATDTLSRVRLFYDELRRRLATEKHLVKTWDRIRASESALYGFSSACRAQSREEVVVPELADLFFNREGQRINEDIRDLCLANLLALKEMGFLLSLPVSDYSRTDHKEKYIMGGYLMGDAHRQWGNAFGTWYQLANLPLKWMSFYTLSSPDPFLPWMWTNPYYDNPANRFVYRTLFPFETTKMVSDMVENNLRFRSLGESDRNLTSWIVLGASWLMRQQEMSNDGQIVPSTYSDSLKNANEFQFSWAAILLKPIKSENDGETKPNHYKKFAGSVYDFQSDKTREAEVYLLPKGRVIAQANNMFLFPLTRVRFLNPQMAGGDLLGYVVALKVDYDPQDRELLSAIAAKGKLTDRHNRVIDACFKGDAGLKSYFNTSNKEFSGFNIPPGIYAETSSNERMNIFLDSIDTEFAKYEAKVAAQSGGAQLKMANVCEEAISGVGQVASAAASLSGFFVPIILDYLAK